MRGFMDGAEKLEQRKSSNPEPLNPEPDNLRSYHLKRSTPAFEVGLAPTPSAPRSRYRFLITFSTVCERGRVADSRGSCGAMVFQD